MYYYVYDEYVQDPKFERDLALIETRLTDLGIAGKIARLALFRDPKELVRDEIRKGAKTVIAVGNDVTLRRVMDAAGDSGVTIGVIPVGKDCTTLCSILGMPSGVDACDIISARIVEELDIGEVNSRRFLHTVHVPQIPQAELAIDRQYKIQAFRKPEIEIRNLALAGADVPAANPTDGKFECVVRTPMKSLFKKKSWNTTVVPAVDLKIALSKSVKCFADSEEFESDELRFKMIPKALRIITGKERKF